MDKEATSGSGEATGPRGEGTRPSGKGTRPSGETIPKLTLGQRILAALPNLQRASGTSSPRTTGRPAAGRGEAPEGNGASPRGGSARSASPGAAKPADASARPGTASSVTRPSRLRDAFLKPAPTGQGAAKADPTADMSNEELTHAIKRIDDRERLYALFAGPLGAAVGIVLTVAAVHANPPLGHKGHEAVSVIAGFGAARVVLGALVVVAALTRRRSLVGFALLFLGTAMGFPFALLFWGLGAWMIWRVFRYQKILTARGAGPQRGRGAQTPRAAARSGSTDARERVRARREARDRRRGKQPEPTGPAASKRYTPPKPTRARPPASS